MRKQQKREILEFISSLKEAHKEINTALEQRKYPEGMNLLCDCQECAIELGNVIETLEGEDVVTVSYIEKYCELIFHYHEKLRESTEELNSNKKLLKKIIDSLDKQLSNMESSIKRDIKEKKEVVFFPYKASMWDSLESIWKAAEDDPDCDVYVVPIPYYDRNPDYSLGEFHYEGKDYPDYVPVVHYEMYDLEQRRPDIIYIHNAYDEFNYVTSVEPRFYSSELKKYTECLVYIPYYLFPKVTKTFLINTPALINADYIIVQNEKVRDAYVNEMNPCVKNSIENKILALGTPKTDKICNVCSVGINIPEQWVIQSKNKKKMFLNTNLSLILNNDERFIENITRVFKILDRRKDVFVIWREHPLTNETLKSMKPGMLEEYEKLKLFFLESGLGVLDTNAEPYEAIYFSDCYFGAGGSLAPIYAVTGKPILLTAYNYPANISNKEVPLSFLTKQAEVSLYFSERYINFLDLFLDNLEILMEYKNKRYQFLSDLTINIDGTVGQKIMRAIKEKSKA